MQERSVYPLKLGSQFLGEWYLPIPRSNQSSVWKGWVLWQHPSSRCVTSVMWRLSVEIDKKMNFPEKLFGFPMIKGLSSQSLLSSFEPTDKMGARVVEATLFYKISKVNEFLHRENPTRPLHQKHTHSSEMEECLGGKQASTQIVIPQTWLYWCWEIPTKGCEVVAATCAQLPSPIDSQWHWAA